MHGQWESKDGLLAPGWLITPIERFHSGSEDNKMRILNVKIA